MVRWRALESTKCSLDYSKTGGWREDPSDLGLRDGPGGLEGAQRPIAGAPAPTLIGKHRKSVRNLRAGRWAPFHR